MFFGDPYGWYCNRCGYRHGSTACPNNWGWIVPQPAAEHCGKCGAPFTRDINGAPQPICVCWNLPKAQAPTGDSNG